MRSSQSPSSHTPVSTDHVVHARLLLLRNQEAIKVMAHSALDFRINLFGLSSELVDSLVDEVFADLLRIELASHEFCSVLKKAVETPGRLDTLIEECVAELCALIKLVSDADIENMLVAYIRSANKSDVSTRLGELKACHQSANVYLAEINGDYVQLSDKRWQTLLDTLALNVSNQHSKDERVVALPHTTLRDLPKPFSTYFHYEFCDKKAIPAGVSLYLMYVMIDMQLMRFLTQQKNYPKILLNASHIESALNKVIHAYFSHGNVELDPYCILGNMAPLPPVVSLSPSRTDGSKHHAKAAEAIVRPLAKETKVALSDEPKIIVDTAGSQYIELSAYHRSHVFYRHNAEELEKKEGHLVHLPEHVEAIIKSGNQIHSTDSKCTGLKLVDKGEKEFKGYSLKLKLHGQYSHLRFPIRQRRPSESESVLLGSETVEIFSPGFSVHK
jgi:hypothetical protein